MQSVYVRRAEQITLEKYIFDGFHNDTCSQELPKVGKAMFQLPQALIKFLSGSNMCHFHSHFIGLSKSHATSAPPILLQDSDLAGRSRWAHPRLRIRKGNKALRMKLCGGERHDEGVDFSTAYGWCWKLFQIPPLKQWLFLKRLLSWQYVW